MRKTLLFIVILFLLLSSGLIMGQVCSPDPNVTKAGLSPDSATNFVKGYVGLQYSQLITIVVPKDTQAIPKPAPPIKFDSIVMTGMTGLPASLTYACYPQRCVWPGNTKGCIIITGTPQKSEIGTHKLTFSGNAYLGGGAITSPIVLNYYKIVIEEATGINPIQDLSFSLAQNIPNPVFGKTQFSYTLPEAGETVFCIYNMLGKLVHAVHLNGRQGNNSYEIDTFGLPPGVYTYSISQGQNRLSKRMLVGNN